MRADTVAVEQKSTALRKELGLTDLVLTQILYVFGLGWVGTAAKLGQSQIVFWLAAMALFYFPQAAVVVHLSRRFPLEGGLYQWTKLGLGQGVAFLVVWNLWVYAIVLLGASGISIANAVIYAVGPSAEWLSGNRLYMAAMSGALLGGLVVVSILGLGVSKWIHNGASVLLMLGVLMLFALPFIGMARGTLHEFRPFAVTAPALTLLSVNIFGKLAVGALSGFEYVAVLAGESRDAKRTMGLSVIIAAPVIALMFILGTSVIQAIVPIGQIDLVGPIPQALRMGLGSTGAAAIVVPFAVAAIASRAVANSSVAFTVTSRMPMVAGWDNLMPAWFTSLHLKYRTPVNSILFIGTCSLVFTLLGMTNVGEQEAFQLLDNAAGILYGLTYLALFAIPLIGLRRAGGRAPLWIRMAAAAGFATTALYVVLSVLPIVSVESRVAFALKITAVVIGANVAGLLLFVGKRPRASAKTVTP